MSLGVLISRVLGLVREQSFAYLFGSGMASDAFIIAFRIPNLFRDLLAEGALSNAFVSVFAKVKSKEEQKQLYSKTIICALISFAFVGVLLFYFTPEIVTLLASKFKTISGKFELTVDLTRILIFFLLFTSLAAITSGALNSRGKFFITALGPASFNVICILGVILLLLFSFENPLTNIYFYTTAALFGGAMQLFVQLPALFKQDIQLFKPITKKQTYNKFFNKNLKKIFFLMIPAVIAQSAVHTNILINTYFAANLEQGSVTWLNYAYRLIHFPLGIFGVALSTASLPILAKLYSNNEIKKFNLTLNESISSAIILLIGSSLGLYAFGDLISALIYQRGNYTYLDTVMTFQAIQMYAIGLFSFASTKILVNCFFAFGKVWVPTLVSFFTVVINYFSASYFSQKLGHEGLALSGALTSSAQFLILATILHVKGNSVFTFSNLKALAASFASGAVFILVIKFSNIKDRLFVIHDKNQFLFFAILIIFIIFLTLIYGLLILLFLPNIRRKIFKK